MPYLYKALNRKAQIKNKHLKLLLDVIQNIIGI